MPPRADSTRCSALAAGRRPRLLIVDPDLLTRWSLSAYLTAWFDVFAAASFAEAEEILSRGPVHAVVLPEGLGGGGSDQLEERARAANAHLLVVRTGTQNHRPRGPDVAFLEKPFDLAVLARLLRSRDATASPDRVPEEPAP
jgi:DNA-binding response OmpR family regulator